MPQIHKNNGVSQDDLSLAAVQRLVTYEDAKATGKVIAPDGPVDESVRDGLACVDLLHRVWPDLESPAIGIENPPPKTLGDFRLICEIGRGGMGTVFEAEQISMGRHVALKVLPFAALVHENSLQRFRNEVRAAAALNHPHIVPVYSIGEERGVHFYAMQLIRGRTMAEMIDELRERGGGKWEARPDDDCDDPTVGLADSTHPTARKSTAVDSRRDTESYRAATRLGIQVAQALQHAHDQGVLHRDIKPSNLLLDAEGTLYVTDFGLARIEADAGMTMTGDIVGTLRYMAPEQALAKRVVVDHRADIYSLGATLYELLTLQPAFGETDRSELLKQIAFEEPRPLRKINSHIPAELETIVLKAMAKNPEERYQTAQQLADDLGAYLEDRPIKAKAPSLISRTAKWSRRHRGLVAAVSVLLIILTVGSLTSTALLLSERHRTQSAAAESKAVVDFLVKDLLAAPIAEVTQDRDFRVSQVLQSAEQKIGTTLAAQPLVEATVRQALASSYFTIGKNSLAVSNARRAFELRSNLLGPVHHDTIDALDLFDKCCAKNEKRLASRKLAEETVDAARRQLGPEHPDTLAAMKILVRNFVNSKLNETEAERAQNICRQTLEVARHTLGPDDKETLGTEYDLACLLLDNGRRNEAAPLIQEVATKSRRRFGIEDNLTLGALRQLANTLESSGQFAEAAEQYKAILDAHRRYYGPKHRMAILVELKLADQYIKLGSIDEARKLYKEGLTLARLQYGFGNYEARCYLCAIVHSLMANGQNDEALALLAENLPSESDAWEAKNFFAWRLSTASDEKYRNGQRAVELATSACELTKYKNAAVLDTLGCAYAETGEFESAVKWSQKALEFSNKATDRGEVSKHLTTFKNGKPWRE